MEKKSRKVLDLNIEGHNLSCVAYYDKKNPYRLYLNWYDGRMHRKQVAAYGNFISVIEHIRAWMHNNHVGFKDCF